MRGSNLWRFWPKFWCFLRKNLVALFLVLFGPKKALPDSKHLDTLPAVWLWPVTQQTNKLEFGNYKLTWKSKWLVRYLEFGNTVFRGQFEQRLTHSNWFFNFKKIVQKAVSEHSTIRIEMAKDGKILIWLLFALWYNFTKMSKAR